MMQIVRACQFEEDGSAVAYALGILEGEERAAFEAHLATCATCPDEVAAYLAAAAAIPLAYDEIVETPPSAALRDRILDAARAERDSPVTVVPPLTDDGSSGGGGGGGGEILTDLDPKFGPLRLFPSRFLMLSLAATLAVLLGASLLLRLATNGGTALTPTPATVTYALGSGGAARGQVAYTPGMQRFSFSVAGLPPLGAGQVYQLWIARSTGLQGASVFSLDGGAGTFDVPLDLTGANALYITIEPGPNGSSVPTTPAVLAGVLTRSPAPDVVPTLPCVVGVATPCGSSILASATAAPTNMAPPSATATATVPPPPALVPSVVPPVATTGPSVPTAAPAAPTAPVAPPLTEVVPPAVVPTVVPEAPTASVPQPIPAVPTAVPVAPPSTPTPIPVPVPVPSAPPPAVPPTPTPIPVPPAPATAVPLPLPATPVPPPAVPTAPITPTVPPPPPPPGATSVPTAPVAPPPPAAPTPTPGGGGGSNPTPVPAPQPPTPTPILPLPPVPTLPPILPTLPPILPTLPPILPPLPPIPPPLPPLPGVGAPPEPTPTPTR